MTLKSFVESVRRYDFIEKVPEFIKKIKLSNVEL